MNLTRPRRQVLIVRTLTILLMFTRVAASRLSFIEVGVAERDHRYRE